MNSIMYMLTEGGDMGMSFLVTASVSFGIFYGMSAWMLDLDGVEVMILWVVAMFLPGFLVMWLVLLLFM